MPSIKNQSAPGANYDHKPDVSRADKGQEVRTAAEWSVADIAGREAPEGPGQKKGAQDHNG